ncbi:transglycosylase domain-containing protein [Alkalihalobacillus pseudalcaliphilus]|uniref:transglycosylase domain-containing protein n=1 Tax=Alkalihalobacillus pseudalcaliphilus TaxID=79884 RepID=UPI00064DDD69|nr:transglycosylase domain-containing protein [Alkalihalobacillus pseudalcaliphilus]KMK75636.1 penicillin-binding protein [Alkalihalobacillus pseudalcaliphilus]
MKVGTGWFMTILMFIGFVFLLKETSIELAQTTSIDSFIQERVDLNDYSLKRNSYILAEDETVISEIFKDENRKYIQYEDIPPHFIDAFISTEDHRFFEHQGYDLPGIVRALSINMKRNRIEEGASTITQQLVRNLYLTHDVSYERKFSEILYATEIENQFSKEEILELYLNTVFFHNRVYGIEAASQYYFNKESNDLSIAEVALLTAVPNNPSYYNPLEHIERTHLRKEWVIDKMFEHGAINQEQLDAAKSEEITLEVSGKTDYFPDYTTFVHHELEQLIAEKEGYTQKIHLATSEEELLHIQQSLKERVQAVVDNGVYIHTALDQSKQNQMIQSFENHLQHTDIQGAASLINHHTNELVAISGGRGFKKFDFHRGYQSYRQPGSTIKPLLVFAPYLEETQAPLSSTVNANNVCYGQGSQAYCPNNYGNSEYGYVSLTRALQQSYNTPAVRLLDQTGIQTAFSYLDSFQFEKVTEEDYRLPAAIGGFQYGFSPLEITRAYSSFHDGFYQPARAIQKVTSLDGKLLYEWNESPVKVWNEETVGKVHELLYAAIANGTGRRAYFPSEYIGGKSGTTNEYHDLWFVGLTENYTAGVWIGYDKKASLAAVNDRQPQLLIWKEIMQAD